MPAVSFDGRYLLVTDSASNELSVVDVRTLSRVTTIPLGKNPHSVAINPVKPLAYIANEDDGTVSAVDLNSMNVVANVMVGKSPNELAISPDGTRLYSVNSGDGTLSVIDALAYQLISVSRLGSQPHGIAIVFPSQDFRPPIAAPQQSSRKTVAAASSFTCGG